MYSFELGLWTLTFLVLFGLIIYEIVSLIRKIRNYLRPITTREANLVIARDHGRCRFNGSNGERCKKESQHLRKIGGFNTPRSKRWVVACKENHLYHKIYPSEAEEILKKI